MNRVVVSAALVLMLSGCGSAESEPEIAELASPASVGLPGEGDLPAGFDESPDGEIRPDSALSAAEVTRLLRVEASDAAAPTSCVPADLTGTVDHVDSAAGHRYGRLELTNVSGRTCTLNGHPGFGARGVWGNTFQNAVEHREPVADLEVAGQVRLVPGDAAFASLEWTGELAGAESERISLFVVQLARGQEAIGIPVNDADAGRNGAPLDIGILTTVRVGAMRPVTTGWTETRSRP